MIKFVGDICYTDNHFDIGYGVGSYIKKGGDVFKHLNKTSNDIWIGNFESVVSSVSDNKDYHSYSFRISPEHLSNYRLFDYYNIANNHVMEHGATAYQQMIENLCGISKGSFGSIKNKTIYFEHQGECVSVTGFCLRREENPFTPLYWSQPELSEIKSELSNLNSDFKVAYIHWGVEFINHPSTEQIKFAHWLIDIGFDLIIGMHPHILQGYEIYNGKHIFYSLGNFVFNMAWEPTKYSVIVNLNLQSKDITYDYIKIDDNYSPIIIPQESVPEKYRFETLNNRINLLLNPEEYIKEANNGLKAYRKANHKAFLKNFFKYDPTILANIILNFLKRKLIK